ncbi:3539_t:CDS:2, partial [Ambispora gerdemannii]
MSEINKQSIKEIEKIDTLSISSSSPISSTSVNNTSTSFSDSKSAIKMKEIEIFGNNNLAKNKRNQPTDYEENPQQLLTTEDDIMEEDKLEKVSRINDVAANDRMDRTSAPLSVSIQATDANLNINVNNPNLSVATYTDQVKSNSVITTINITENPILNQQEIDIEKLTEITMDDLLILFNNSFKYNEANLEKRFIYHLGINVDKDYNQALKYYQHAAVQ